MSPVKRGNGCGRRGATCCGFKKRTGVIRFNVDGADRQQATGAAFQCGLIWSVADERIRTVV
ncbi:hypothetical protein [Desulfogranum japonicum]|uniref:hypothetical protein n=1 Tax=Desulfogranum japonicum TaxID=231447 RepID=UPI0012946C0D|nr:hypothetical protein [Desulfogranum japonicum]